jgi:hypothetical protein
MTDPVQCEVNLPDHLRVAEYANAFRVFAEPPNLVLEFSRYSETENKAVVIARILVQPPFLQSIFGRISTVIRELQAKVKQQEPTFKVTEEGLMVAANGVLKPFVRGSKEDN